MEGKLDPGGQGQLRRGDCEGFGGSGGGGVPRPRLPSSRRTTLARKQRFNRPHPANFRLCRIFQKPQSFGHRKVFKNRKLFISLRYRKLFISLRSHRKLFISLRSQNRKLFISLRRTANFSFLCGVPQTFHFSAEYRKLFSRRQAGLGPPGSSLWPVARAGSE